LARNSDSGKDVAIDLPKAIIAAQMSCDGTNGLTPKIL
jgi:hypothetical protein